MSIYLIRHGETEWTLSHRHTGLTDVPLTVAGEDQARELGQIVAGIRFAAAWVSPRQRAQRTAQLAGLGNWTTTALLQEFDYGAYEGLTTAEIRRLAPGWDIWRDGCPGGETAAQVLERGREILATIKAQPRSNYALVGHGHALRALAAAYVAMPVELCRHLALNVASVSILAHDRACPVIQVWNLGPGQAAVWSRSRIRSVRAEPRANSPLTRARA
ncbi:MAG: histidine phosphatase family protein [Candidatus Dormibacteria bacterium]